MTRFQKIATASLCLALAVSATLPPLLRSAPAADPAARTPAAIMADLQTAQNDATKFMPSLTSLADPDFRNGDGQKALPAIKKMIDLFHELETAASTKDEKDSVHMSRYMFMAFANTLGDNGALSELTQDAQPDTADALPAKSALALSNWLLASKDAPAQLKLLADFTPVAKANPDSEAVASILAAMTSFGPANNDVTKKVIEVIRTNLKGPAVTALLTQLDGQQSQMALLGKPLAISGRTSTGGTFATADLKGKVVMFDFWATWCGPCIAELPNVKKAYADFHAKGFEIVGFSCDANDEVLNAFTAKNEMPWIQLRETTQNEQSNWHPIAKQFHVEGIPQMFLIDRQGILRYVDARENLAKKVAELLAEPAPK